MERTGSTTTMMVDETPTGKPLAYHDVANIFPLLTGAEYDELKADIAAHGLIEPIWLHDGKIIDGRNRYRACLDTGIEPRFRTWNGHGSLIEFVVSLNLHRRHLTSGQRAALAVDLLPLLESEAKERQRTAQLGVYGGKPLPEIFPEAVRSESREAAATITNTNPRYVSDAKKLHNEAPDLFQKVRSGDIGITEAKRELKEREREVIREHNRALVADTPPADVIRIETTEFQTIVLDPPWDWGDEGDVDQFGRGRPTYATMPVDEVASLPILDLAAPNAHLYLWITNRSLPKGFALLEAWGFRYVTMLTWVKPSIGMGNYYRGTTEHVLFGVRGSLPLLRRDVGTHFLAKRPGPHSAKPDEFYELIESCSPGPWLEMFSRRERPGWVRWGAEA